jgi:hypothetical protein
MLDQLSEQRVSDDESEPGIDGAVENPLAASGPPSDEGATPKGTDEKMASQNADESDVRGSDPDEDIPDEDTPGEPSPGGLPPDGESPQGDASE